MPDPLLATMLQKASSIGPAAPSGLEPVRQALDNGMGMFKGVTGLGDQGPAGPTATNLGAMLGAGLPLAGVAEKLVPSLMKLHQTMPDAPASKLIEMLYNFKGEEPGIEGMAARFAQNRATPSRGHSAQTVLVPEGFTAGYSVGPFERERISIPKSPNVERHEAWVRGSRSFIKPPVAPPSVTSIDELSSIQPGAQLIQEPKTLSTKGSAGRSSYTKSTNKLNPDMVRDIRTLSKDEAVNKYPNIPRGTVEAAWRRDSWNQVK